MHVSRALYSQLQDEKTFTYLHASNESMRVIAPVGSGLPRRVEFGSGGAMIGPQYVSPSPSILSPAVHLLTNHFSVPASSPKAPTSPSTSPPSTTTPPPSLPSPPPSGPTDGSLKRRSLCRLARSSPAKRSSLIAMGSSHSRKDPWSARARILPWRK